MGLDKPLKECALKASIRSGSLMKSPGGGILFNGGQSALEWRQARQNIVGQFQMIPGGWDIVKSLTKIVDGIVVEDLSETEYSEVEPTVAIMVDAVIARRLKSARKALGESVKRVGKAVTDGVFTQHEGDQRKFDVRSEFDKKISSIEDSRSNLMDGYTRAHAVWKKGKQDFEDVRGQVLAVFSRIFAKSVVDQVAVELEDLKFRAAFGRLNTVYSLSTGGLDNVKSVLSMLTSKKFNPEVETLTTHIQQMRGWNAQLEGDKLADGLMLVYIMDSMSACTSFKEDIEVVRRTSLTLTAAIGLFQATSSRLIVEMEAETFANQQLGQQDQAFVAQGGNKKKLENRKLNKQVKKKVRFALNAAAAIAAKPFLSKEEKKKLKCAVCQKMGHSKETCFSVVPCSICNQCGHAAWNCRNNSDSNNNSNRSSGSNLASMVPVKDNKSKVYFPETTGSDFSSESTGMDMDVLSTSCKKFETPEDVRCGDDKTASRLGESANGFERHELESVSDQLVKKISALLVCATGYTGLCHCLIRIIIDSGASSHMAPLRSMLQNLRSINGEVKLGDNNVKLAIEAVGSTSVPGLTNVLLVPKLSCVLLSIPQFDKEGYKSEFSDGKAIVTRRNGNVILTGTLRDGLYELDDVYSQMLLGPSCNLSTAAEVCDPLLEEEKEVPTNHDSVCFSSINGSEVSECAICFNCAETNIMNSNDVLLQCWSCNVESADKDFVNGSAPRKLKSTLTGMNPLELLHRETGHISGGYLKRMLRKRMVKGARCTYDQVKKLQMRVCFDCLNGRMKANPGRPVSSHEYPVFGKVAADYKGPFKVKSYHKFNGFMLFSDHKSHLVTSVMMKSKEGVVGILDDYLHTHVVINNCTWEVLQSDYDKIFRSAEVKAWLIKHHIKLYTSAPYTHDQNGQIERDVQNVMDKARILMGVYNTPEYFWEFAVLIACYLINRSPHASMDITPLQAAFGEIPDISNFVAFYAPGVYHVTKEERMARGAWAPKAEPCRMLGYDETCKNTYIVYNVRTKKIVSRRDCIFDESMSAQDLVDASIRRHGKYEEDTAEFPGSDLFALDSDSDSEPEEELDEEDKEEESNMVENNSEMCELNCTGEFSDDVPYREQCPRTVGCARVSDAKSWTVHAAMVVHEALALPPNPADIHVAMADPIYGDDWREALRGELTNFDSREILRLEKDRTGRAGKTRLVLTYSYKNDYTIKVKVRMVFCGYSQIYGVDYLETFSPTASSVVVMILVHIAASRGLFTGVFDVSAAFLEGRTDIVNYCRLPKELYKPGQFQPIYAVLGNFYGEKQAPKIWYELYHDIMITMGFIRCPLQPCLYAIFRGDSYMFVANHVDDGEVASNNDKLVQEFMDHLLTRVKKAEYMVDFKKFLGMDFERDPQNHKVKLHHNKYIVEKFGIATKKEKIPMSNLTNLRTQLSNPANESLLSVIGTLRFPADRCRPDILVATGEISCGGASEPSDEHWKVSRRIINYLSSTPELGVTLGGAGPIELFAFCDASYITDGNSKSRLGGCVFSGYDSGAISSFSTNNNNSKAKLSKQFDEDAMEVEEPTAELMSTVSHSSCEAEIKGIDLIVLLLLHIFQIYEFLRVPVQLPIKVFVDNTSAIELCETLKSNHKVKHINMRINFIREQINAGFIELHFVPTKFNVADILTKPLSYDMYIFLRNYLLNGFGGVHPETLFETTAVFAKANLAECSDGRD